MIKRSVIYAAARRIHSEIVRRVVASGASQTKQHDASGAMLIPHASVKPNPLRASDVSVRSDHAGRGALGAV